MQMQYSQMYGKFLLDFQSANGWIQVAQGWVQMANIESGNTGNNNGYNNGYVFEEENSDNDNEDLEEDDDNISSSNYDAIERQSEQTLLFVLKIMYLQAAQKLNDVKTTSYQNKGQLAVLVQAGLGQVFPQIISLSYYTEMMRLMSAAITIQRQDAWNTWLLHEIMETEEFGNSHNGLPTSFATTLAHSRAVAMELYYSEATYDMQVYFMDYYIQMSLMSLLSQQQGSANANSATSFVEEGVTAEPSKPFFPFMMMGGMGGMMGPQYLSYMAMYLKYSTIFMNLQAAQGLYTHATVEINPNAQNVNAGQMKIYASSALQQWAYLKYYSVMLQMWGLFSGMPSPSANAAASNSLIQTDAQAQPSA